MEPMPATSSTQSRSCSPRRDGAVAVEFAMLLPIILLFFGAMIETSRALLLQHTVDAAAYEGARAGMVPGGSSSDARAAAMVMLEASRLKNAVVTVDPEVLTEETALISVTVQVPVADNCWTSPMWFTAPYIKSQVTLFCERPPLITLTGIPKIKKNGNGNAAAAAAAAQ